jgi:Protein of unknown function (DUF4241)
VDRPTWADLLRDGAELTSSTGSLRIEHREIGRLNLPSGRVIAADALVEPTLPPFARSVPPGQYPVRIAIAHLNQDKDQRIAAAWLAFGVAPVAVWEAADLEGGPASAYGVDSGTGSFLSQEAAAVFAERLSGPYADSVMEQMESNYVDTRNWAMVELPGTDGLNLALFSSGFGDGAYASYWGMAETGEAVALLTDFGLLDPPESLERKPSAKPWWKFW